MAEPQLPHILYTKELIRKGRGYPFWYPEPDSNAPIDFKQRGIYPGDVGIINDDGGFNFLFSIFSDANGQTVGHAPDGFQPLLLSEVLQDVPHPAHGDVHQSPHVSSRWHSVDVSAQDSQSTPVAGISFDVGISEAPAAILCLPDYSTKYEARSKGLFEDCARRHGASWYNHVNGTLHWNAPNGSLYLITGCDKATTWANAVIGRTDRSITVTLECTLLDTVGGQIKVAQSWIDNHGMENGLFPIPSQQYPYPIGLKNQCIFARGFIISLSQSLFRESWEVVPHLIGGSSKDRLPSFDTRNTPLPQSDGKIGGWMSRFSSLFGLKTLPKDPDFDQSRMLVDSADHELLVAEVSEFPTAESELLNPSALMNEYLLSKDPSLEIAITHDEEWMAVMQQYEEDTYLSEDSLWSKLKDSLDAKLSTLSNPVGMPSNMSQETVLFRSKDISNQASFIQAKPLPKHQVHLSREPRFHSGTSSDTDKTQLASHGKVDGEKFWAVIIGINAYKTFPLRGCVSDAEMVAKFLIDDLLVPESNIQLLLGTDTKEFTVPGNKPPTRANIVDAILGLSTNPNIQHGDNIIIYFAGYGTTYDCADFFKVPVDMLGQTEALCPIDRHSRPAASAKTPSTDLDDAKGSVTSDPQVPDISDREINTILAEIARNKGDHITFIIDCCFYANATRGSTKEGARFIIPLPSSSIPHMFSAADETLKHLDGYQSISEVEWNANMDTHVVLVACEDYEDAQEVKGDDGFNGVFTPALIAAFKSADLDDESLTYYKLLKALSMPKNPTQNPVIAGKHKHSRLWFQDDDSSNIKASSD